MRTKKPVNRLLIWLPPILVIVAYCFSILASIILYIPLGISLGGVFTFRVFLIRLFIPLVFPLLLIILYKIKSNGLHATMAALNLLVIVLAAAYSVLQMLYAFDIYDGYMHVKFLSYFSGFGSISNMVSFFISNYKLYNILNLFAGFMVLIAHFITFGCFIASAQQDENLTLYQQRKN